MLLRSHVITILIIIRTWTEKLTPLLRKIPTLTYYIQYINLIATLIMLCDDNMKLNCSILELKLT